MTMVLYVDRHWNDDDSRNFLKDPLALMNLDPTDFKEEDVTIFHKEIDADLLAQVVTKMTAYGATVTTKDQR